MKVKLLSTIMFAFLLCFIATNNSFAKSSYSNALTVGVGDIATDRTNICFEHQLSHTNSFTLFLKYNFVSSWNGYGLGGSYRWYIDLFKTRQKAIEGFSVGPRVIISSWSWDGNISKTATAYEGGMVITGGGEAVYKWVWSGFTLEAGLNLDFAFIRPDGTSVLTPFSLVLNAGYAW